MKLGIKIIITINYINVNFLGNYNKTSNNLILLFRYKITYNVSNYIFFSFYIFINFLLFHLNIFANKTFE